MGVQLVEKGSRLVVHRDYPEEDYQALEGLLTRDKYVEFSISLPQPAADVGIGFDLKAEGDASPIVVVAGSDVVKRLYDELNNTFDQLVPNGPLKLYESEIYERHRLKIWLTQDGRLARFLHDWTFGEWGPDSRPERQAHDIFYLPKPRLEELFSRALQPAQP